MADDQHVRAAVAGDADQIARVQTLGWQHGYTGLLPDDFLSGLDLEASVRRWRSQLAHAERTTTEFVAVAADGSVQGMMVVGASTDPDVPADGPVGHVYALYVLAGLWGSGLGYALHERGMAALAGAGHTEATLWVLEGNDRAFRFYGRQGWADDHLTKTEELAGATLVEHRLRRTLAATVEPGPSGPTGRGR